MSAPLMFQPKHVDAALREWIEANDRPPLVEVSWSIGGAFSTLRRKDLKAWARRRGVRVVFA